MGILTSGLLGPVHKTVGPSVTRNHRGKNIISANYRIKPKQSTAKQWEAQVKFSLLNGFLSSIGKLVKPGFKKYAKGKSKINAAYRYNYDHAFIESTESISINFALMVYSRGRVAEAEAPKATLGSNCIVFTWEQQNQQASCLYTDRASFLVYNPLKQTAIILRAVAERYATQYTVMLPKDYAGDLVHCYMNFDTQDGKLAGDSSYVAEVTCV